MIKGDYDSSLSSDSLLLSDCYIYSWFYVLNY